MAKKIIFECDVCGITKKENNHWWDVFIVAGVSLGGDEGNDHLEIHPMDPAAEDTYVVACGEVCVIKLVSRFLSTGKLTMELI